MSSKRAICDDKNRVKKRLQKSALKASPSSVQSDRYVYLATVEEYGPYREESGPHIFEVYETLVDANERLRTYQQRLLTEEEPIDSFMRALKTTAGSGMGVEGQHGRAWVLAFSVGRRGRGRGEV